jgi:hypothetical protein
MATTFTSTTLSGIYNDDYDKDDNYHQILFNSGRALQARELTQLQTMIYQEMGRFGRNVFKEGAAVSSGGTAINNNYDFVQISSVTSGGDFADIQVGAVFISNVDSLQARVVEVKPLDVDNGITVDTLFVQYINGGENQNSTIGDESRKFSPSAQLTQLGGGYNLVVATNAVAPATDVSGKGVRFDVAEGDFFVLGRFVHTPKQSLILSAYNTEVNTVIGFKVVQEVISVNDTTALYDNAGGLVNTASPGADRYRIVLQLTEQSKVTSDDTFVFLARIENSQIVEESEATDGYNKINDAMALRTFEESGDYVVNPFTISFDSADASNLSLTVSTGLAYVRGYRVENPSPIELRVPRSQETDLVNNQAIPVVYGNYAECSGAPQILPELDLEENNIYNSYGGSTVIGTCRIRGMDYVGGKFRVFLFDIKMNEGADFADAREIGKGSDLAPQRIQLPTNVQLLGTTDNDLFFATPRPRPASLSDITLVRQVYQEKVANGSGVVTLDTLTGGDTYEDTSLWMVSRTNGNANAIAGPTISSGGAGQTNASISGLTAGATYGCLVYVRVGNPVISSKVSTSTSSTITGSSGVYDIGVPDVYEIVSIKEGSVSGIDVSERFTLDDGQRDNFYDTSKLILNAGEDDPSSIYVEYKYFAHDGIGDFYAPESYTGVPYADIPTHVLQDGTEISLRNYLDFRSDKQSAGTFTNIKYLPRTGTSITADTEYYLPRADKLIVTQEGDFQVLMGQQSIDPQLKKTPDNSLELYQILMGANTANADDVQVRSIEHKHYTMSDIAKLDNKVEELKAYTEFNIAELRAYHAPSLDSDGIERAQSGIIVEEAKDQSNADTENTDYAASIDPENNLIRPLLDEDNIRLVFSNTMSSNVVKRGDNLYLNYDSDSWKSQSLASRFVNINPFGVVDNVGVLKMSPSSDEWKDSKEPAEKVIKGASKISGNQSFLWNNWQWNWKGRSDEDLWQTKDEWKGKPFQAVRNRQSKAARDQYYSLRGEARGSGGYVQRVVQDATLRQTIGNKTVDVALVPWIRSRKIYFHAKGLKPGTKFTPFFDGKDVSAWCRPEEAFVQWSDREDDNGNKYRYTSLTEHPDGTGTLVSDANGEVIGSFWIPNIRPEYYIRTRGKNPRLKNAFIRFRAGVREFKLLDITSNDWAKAGSKAFAYYNVSGAIEKRQSNILSTRTMRTTSPMANKRLPMPYQGLDIANTLNNLNTVNLIAPQLAGKYSPLTTPINPVNYSGQFNLILNDYVNINYRQTSGNYVTPNIPTTNPLAQTFYVDNQFGVVLTKIKLYFRSKPSSDNMPVSIHLRPVVNGKPSSSEIVPDSHVFLNPSDVNVIEGSPTLSLVQASPTEFVFEEPVFLQPWTHYAIVVTSQSTDYEIWTAKTLENVLGSTGRQITTQPSPGALFLPQNGVLWNESKDQDLMFDIVRAKFDLTGGSAILRTVAQPAKLLDNNPIRLTSGSGKVYVKAPNHGLAPGDTVQLDSCENISNIIASTYLNGINLTVDSADIHGYTFTMSGGVTADEDITGGGERVLTQQNNVFDVANPNIETVVPNFTSVDMSAKFTTGIHIGGNSVSRFLPNGISQSMSVAKWQRITPDQNIEFKEPRAIYHSDITDATSGLGGADETSKYSAYFKVDFKSSNDYVSPIVDMQRSSLTIVGEVFDDPVAAPHIYPVLETEPYGGTTASKHITTPVTTEIPSVGLDIRAQCSLPAGARVDVYYRTASADENIYEKSWIYKSATVNLPTTDANEFVDVNWLPGNKNGSLAPFQQSQVKFVMIGKDRSPVIRDISIKYLAT